MGLVGEKHSFGAWTWLFTQLVPVSEGAEITIADDGIIAAAIDGKRYKLGPAAFQPKPDSAIHFVTHANDEAELDLEMQSCGLCLNSNGTISPQQPEANHLRLAEYEFDRTKMIAT